MKRGLSFSFSGSGHLLIYQLGVAKFLRDLQIPIQAVAGSSGGAIAASLLTLSPSQIENYSDMFIQKRGGGLTLLREVLDEKALSQHKTTLYVCTTRNEDGKPHLFRFDKMEQRLFDCVKASCTFPLSFHPADLVSSNVTYPRGEGVEIDGEYYCDGGISTPAPEIPDASGHTIIVSPIVGKSDLPRISPSDRSYSILPSLQWKGGFGVRSSFQNLRALRVASGSTTSKELREWFDQGIQDANRFWEKNRAMLEDAARS